MYDYHMHSRVSFDAHDPAEKMVQAALEAGLKEICFTDHIDYDPRGKMGNMAFDTAEYSAEYDRLSAPGLKIRRGMEFGMTRDNVAQFQKDLQRRPFDFVLGSIHFVDGLDVYFQDFWAGKTVWQAERRCLEETLACVRLHDDFDVLAHLTYIGKTAAHPAPRPVPYEEHREIIDEILRVLARQGQGTGTEHQRLRPVRRLSAHRGLLPPVQGAGRRDRHRRLRCPHRQPGGTVFQGSLRTSEGHFRLCVHL